MNSLNLNLGDFRSVSRDGKKSKVYTGRDRAKAVLESSGLNTFVDNIEGDFQLTISIPDDIFSINPSFFEELLYPIVNRVGREAFYSNVKFINLGNYNYKKPLDEAVSRILRSSTGLD
jgi:hypothetical protein